MSSCLCWHTVQRISFKCCCWRTLWLYWELNLLLYAVSSNPSATLSWSAHWLFFLFLNRNSSLKFKCKIFCILWWWWWWQCVSSPPHHVCVCVHVTAHISADLSSLACGWLVLPLCGCVCVCFLCAYVTLGHDSTLWMLIAASLHHRSKRFLSLYRCFSLKTEVSIFFSYWGFVWN